MSYIKENTHIYKEFNRTLFGDTLILIMGNIPEVLVSSFLASIASTMGVFLSNLNTLGGGIMIISFVSSFIISLFLIIIGMYIFVFSEDYKRYKRADGLRVHSDKFILIIKHINVNNVEVAWVKLVTALHRSHIDFGNEELPDSVIGIEELMFFTKISLPAIKTFSSALGLDFNSNEVRYDSKEKRYVFYLIIDHEDKI